MKSDDKSLSDDSKSNSNSNSNSNINSNINNNNNNNSKNNDDASKVGGLLKLGEADIEDCIILLPSSPNYPAIFPSFSRRQLGKLCGKSIKLGVVGVRSGGTRGTIVGAEREFKLLKKELV